MTEFCWQRTWIRFVSTVLVFSMMALIFIFSTQNAEASDETSGGISRMVIGILYPGYDAEAPERKTEIYDTVQHYVRKTAHFTEYLILGLLTRICLLSWFGKRRWLTGASWGTATLYAVTDEMHQLLIDGRSGQWTDVLLDSAGVLAGVMIAGEIIRKTEQKKGRK